MRDIKLGWTPRSFERTGNYLAVSSSKEVGKTIIISLQDDSFEELAAQGAAVLEKEDRLLSFRGRYLDIQTLSTKKKILRIECSQPIQKIKALPDEKTIVILYANGKVGILDASGR